ncbi:MAG: hypothetical protein QUS08_10115 [Methanothrix sp.]|nr:hypothetical protein [Methanothrix sp.]
MKSGRVYIIDWDLLNGLDQVVGPTYLAELLHPDADLDPVSVHMKYPEGRTFVYPGLKG